MQSRHAPVGSRTNNRTHVHFSDESSDIRGASTSSSTSLTVRFGDTLQLILLLDSVAVGRSLGGIDQLVSETFSNGLDVSESRLSCASDEKPNGLVDATQRRHVDRLTTDRTRTTDTSGVFTGPAVDDSVRDNLQRILSSEQMDDFKSVLDDTDGHQFLAIIAPVHHQRIGQTLHNGALRLSEPLGGISSGGVGKILGELLFNGDVVGQTDVVDDHIVSAPLIKQLDLG